MVLVLGSLQLGLIYGLLAIGIYIVFRIMNIPDLTAEGSFTLGLTVSAVLSIAGHPVIGILLGMAAGALAGVVTGFLQTKLMIHPVLSGILTMSGLYSINIMIMGESSNLSLIKADTIFRIAYKMFPGLSRDAVKIIIPAVFAVVFSLILILFFRTRLGLCIRATGDNEDMVRASSINADMTKVLALAIANACIAAAGGLLAQYQGYADINSGVGILVVGLASVIIGEVFGGRRNITAGIICSVFGAVIYRFIIAFAILHFKLLYWNTKQYLLYKKSDAYKALIKSNGQISIMALPLTYTMSINVGFVLGAGLSHLLAPLLSLGGGIKIKAHVTLNAFLLAFGVSSAVGLIFGILPARQAANKNLIDILI